MFLDEYISGLFTYESLRYSLIGGLFIGFLAPLVGSIAVMKRLSMIADTLSHFSLAGIAIGVFISRLINPEIIPIDPIYMGMIFSILGTFIIEKLRGFYKNYKELSMPIVMSLGVALSGIFIKITPGISNQYTNSLLYGDINAISKYDIYFILIVTIIICSFFIIFYKKIVTLCFDEVYAKISGINVRIFQLILTLIMSVVISIFIDLIGVLLISALLIVPVASSILISHSFKGSLIISIIFSEISIILGSYISYYLYLPSGSFIVLLNITILFISMIISWIRKHFKKDDSKSIDNT